MAREQKIVARDFLGLGNIRSTPQGENSRLLETRKEMHQGRHYLGVSHSMWNTAATMHSLRNLQEGTSVDQNLSNPPLPHLLQDIDNHNQRKTLRSKSFTLDHTALREDHGDNSFLQSAVWSSQGNLATGGHFMARAGRCFGQLPLPSSILTVPLVGDNPQTKARMLSSEKQSNAQLTIFYAGNVNVYDDISLDKALAIMHLAASGSSCTTKNAPADQQFGLSNAATSESRPGSPQHHHSTSAKKQELQLNAPSAQLAADRASQNSPATKQTEPSKPLIPCAGQPVVYRALPQARKASLARFLEKRKERVQSKSPYPSTKPSSEQALLPGERFSSSNNDAISPTPWDECVDKKPVPMSCWMEEMTSAAAKTGFVAESRMVGEGETDV